MTPTMTPKQAADAANTGANPQGVQTFVDGACPVQLAEYFHYLDTGVESKQFRVARIALDIRLAEDAERTAQKLVTGTDALITETKILVKLTHSLKMLTIVLVALGVFEVIKFIFNSVCHH
jgi:hypothetical protein